MCKRGHLWGSPSIERCSIDQLTTMLENGDSQKARFHFPAFRFIEQQNETLSTYYLHCITRLCERSTCSTFKVGRPHMHVKQKSPVNPDRMINSGVSLRLVWSTAMQQQEEEEEGRGVHGHPGEHHRAVCAHGGYKDQDRNLYVSFSVQN